jgi:hypothetical protein
VVADRLERNILFVGVLEADSFNNDADGIFSSFDNELVEIFRPLDNDVVTSPSADTSDVARHSLLFILASRSATFRIDIKRALLHQSDIVH